MSKYVRKISKFSYIAWFFLSYVIFICVVGYILTAKDFAPVEFKKSVYLDSNKIETSLNLDKVAHIMRVSYVTDNKISQPIVVLNGTSLDVDKISYDEGRQKKRLYVFVRSGLVRDDRNRLEISFDREKPRECDIQISNYRKEFSDKLFVRLKDDNWFSENWLLYMAGIIPGLILILILKYCAVETSESRFNIPPRRRDLILLPCLFLLIILLVSLASGYYFSFAATFLRRPVIVLLALPVLAFKLFPPELPQSSFIKRKTAALFVEHEQISMSARFFCMAAMTLFSLAVYWPSFFHLFRHDDWFLFFSSRDEVPDFNFFLKHIDWQLQLPYDRLMFRPLHHGMLAFNRVVFGENYVAGHILTFLKHITTVICFWALLLQHSKRFISVLAALLFSVAVTKIDAVTWPHVDGYVITTLLLILSIMVFRKIQNDRISIRSGTVLLSSLLCLNILSTEIVFFVPVILFVSYWLLFRKKNDEKRRQKNIASFIWLLSPFVIWGILFLVHLYFAYQDLAMSPRPESIGLFAPAVNVFKLPLYVFSALIFPFIGEAVYGDKVYFRMTAIGIAVTAVFLFGVYRNRNKCIKKIDPYIRLIVLLMLTVSGVICFGRGAMLDGRLSHLTIFTHYSYCLTALLLYLAYLLIDFDKLLKSNRYLIFSFSIGILILFHGYLSFQICGDVGRQTSSLRNYYDSVRTFIHQHKDEEDFSIKVLDRCPEIKAFEWYHETSIDGLFSRYIDNSSPRYVLEYDYEREKLSYSIYDGRSIDVQIESNVEDTHVRADFYNSTGIGFGHLLISGTDLMVGVSEVTQQQWTKVMESNPSIFKNDRLPVENVSYLDVLKFIDILNQNDQGMTYRLPTMGECLYLAERLEGAFDGNMNQANINKYFWTRSNASNTTHAAKTLRAVPGFPHDLIGNVWEWTSTPIQHTSHIPPLEFTPRKCFGGSWRDDCMSFTELQTHYPVDFRHEHLGFRLVAEVLVKQEVVLAGKYN